MHAQQGTHRDCLCPVVVVVLRLDELDDDGAHLLLHVAPLHQALLQQHQQRRLRRLTDLIG